MKNVAKLSHNEREELFIVAAREVSLPEAMVEKDFWVCWTLDYLFHESPWKNHFAFKGGTSLSRCFGLIDRFSEDIDLILDWRLLECAKKGPWAERSKNQRSKLNEAINAETGVFLKDVFTPRLKQDFSNLLTDKFRLYIDEKDPQTVCFEYAITIVWNWRITLQCHSNNVESKDADLTGHKVSKSAFYYSFCLMRAPKGFGWLYMECRDLCIQSRT